MDSLRGIPVEHKLETFSVPSTGTTACHPKNLAMSTERNSALDTLVTFSLLVHMNGEKAYSPQKYQTHKNTR